MKNLLAVLVTIAACASAQAAVQIVTPVADQTVFSPGETVSIDFLYNVDDGNQDLSGLGFYAHFDSSFLSYSGYSDFNAFGADLTVEPSAAFAEADLPAFDSDANTDQAVQANWANLTVFDFPEPNQDLPVNLVTVSFTVLDNPGITNINLTEIATAAGYEFQGGSMALTIVPEPAAYASIAGILALGAVIIRRRRQR